MELEFREKTSPKGAFLLQILVIIIVTKQLCLDSLEDQVYHRSRALNMGNYTAVITTSSGSPIPRTAP